VLSLKQNNNRFFKKKQKTWVFRNPPTIRSKPYGDSCWLKNIFIPLFIAIYADDSGRRSRPRWKAPMKTQCELKLYNSLTKQKV